MSPSEVHLDSIKQKYLRDFQAKGIELDGAGLARLNEFVIKEHTQKTGSPPANTSIPGSGFVSQVNKRAQAVPQEKSGYDLGLTQKIGVGLWYGLESYLWDVPGLISKKAFGKEPYDFQKLTAGEKATAVAAGGGALFLPGSGGLRGISMLGGKITSRIAGIGGIFGKTVKGATVVSKEATKSLAKGLSKEYKNLGVDVALKSKLNKTLSGRASDIIGLNAGKEARKVAVNNLEINMQAAAYKALKDAGVKGTESSLRNTAAQLSRGMINKLTVEKKPVADIAHWISDVVGGAPDAMKLRKHLATYAGMVVNDAFVLGTHTATTSLINAYKNDKAWNTNMGNALKGAMILSVGFPLVRAIPWGGQHTVSRGAKYLWNKYRRTNYEALAAKNGQGAVDMILKMMLKKTDVENMVFKSLAKAGEQAPTGRQLLSKLNRQELSPADVTNALVAVRKQVTSKPLSNWIREYPGDLLASTPRMVGGVALMNYELFERDDWKYMDEEELLSHIVMAGIFAKGRGAWDRKKMESSQIDYAKYKGHMRNLGLKGKELEDLFNFYEITGENEAVLAGHEARPILEIFRAFKNNEADTITGEFRSGDHKVVADFAKLYNAHLYAEGGGTGYDPVNIQRYSAKDLYEMKKQLQEVSFKDGTTIRDLGFQGSTTKLNIDFSRNVQRQYGDILEEMRDAGLPVSVDYDEQGRLKVVFGEVIIGADRTDVGDYEGVDKFNVITQRLKEAGLATENINMKKDIDNPDHASEINHKKAGRILNRWEKNLSKMIYGKDVGLVDAIEDNVFLDRLHTGQQSEAIDRIYNIMTERFLTQDTPASNFLKMFKNLFYFANAPVSNWDEQVVFKRSPRKENETEDAYKERMSAEGESFAEMKKKVGQINSLKLATTNKGHRKTIAMTVDEMKIAYDSYEQVFNRFPEDLQMQGVERVGLEYFIHRFAENKDIPEETYKLYQAGVDPHFSYLHMDTANGKVIGKSDKTIRKMLNEKNITGEEADEIMRMHREMRKELEKVPGIEFHDVEIQKDQIAKMPGPSEIKSLYETRKIESAKNLAKESLSTIEKLGKKGGFETEVDRITEILDSKVHPDNVGFDGRINALAEVSDILDIIKSKDYAKEEHIKNAIDKVDKEIKDYVHKQTAAQKRKKIPDMEREEKLKNLFVGTIKDALKIAIDEEAVYKNRFAELSMDLFSGIMDGQVTAAMGYLHHDKLRSELLTMINGGKETTTLSSAVEIFQQDFSFKNLQDMITKRLQSVNKNIAIDDPTAYFKATRETLESLLGQRVRRDDLRSPVQIGKDWGLVDPTEPNKLDPEIVDRIVTADKPGVELVKIIRESIEKDKVKRDFTGVAKELEVQKFIKSDGVTLLSFLTNSVKVARAKIQNGYIVYDMNDSANSTKVTEFSDKFPNKLIYMDESGTVVDKNDPRKSQRFMMGITGEIFDIQKMLDEAYQDGKYVPSYLTGEIYKENRYKVDVSKLRDKGLDTFPGRPILMRLGNKAVLFLETKDNVEYVNQRFQEWYDKWAGADSPLNSAEKENFIKMWKGVADASTKQDEKTMLGGRKDVSATDSNNLKNKMTVLFISDVMNKRWVKEFMEPRIWQNAEERALFEDKLYQRSLITNAGNGQRVRKDILKWMKKRTKTWGGITAELDHFIKNPVIVGILSDEVRKGLDPDGKELWDKDSPFHIRSVTERILTAQQNNNSLTLREKNNAKIQLRDIESNPKDYPSLDASSVDGIMYISERLAKILYALKGFDMGEFNGLKPYHFDNSDASTLIAKGYYVYDREVAQNMGNTDVLMGESASKIFNGESVAGSSHPIEGFKILNGSNSWLGYLGGMTDKNRMYIDIENISLGVPNVDKNVASRSHTITDYQNLDFIKEARIWQELKEIISKVSAIDMARMDGNTELSLIMEAAHKSDGFEYTEGATSIALNIIKHGGESNNPVIRRSIKKLIQGPLLDIVRTANSEHSVDAMIAPDLHSDLRIPVFIKVEKLDANGQRRREGDKVYSNRYQVQLGGIKVPHKLGTRKIRNLDKTTFVFTSGGMDVLVSPNSKSGFKQNTMMFPKLKTGEKWDIRQGEGITTRGLDADNNIGRDRKLVNSFIDLLGNRYKGRTEITVKDLFNLIEDLKNAPSHVPGYPRQQLSTVNAAIGRLWGSPENVIKIPRRMRDALIRLDFGLTVAGHPIPRIGMDMGVLRIEGIGLRSEGKISKINHYDLRTGFQRDHDGDRYYLHHDMPITMMDNLRNKYANVEDYRQLPKNSNDLNMFGIDGEGKAGQVRDGIGFDKMHAHVQQQKMNVGRAIAMKSILTTLGNSRMEIDGKMMTSLGNIDYAKKENPQVHQIAFGKLEKWLGLKRNMELNQSSVDVFKGTNDVAGAHNEAIMDAMLFGIAPEGMSEKLAREFNITPENSIFGREMFESPAKRAVIKEVIRQFRKSAKIFNDPYDEGGQRSPTDVELRDAHNSMRMMYGDTQYMNRQLFQNTFKRALRSGNMELAQGLLTEFYGKDGHLGSESPMFTLREYLRSGEKTQAGMRKAAKFLFDSSHVLHEIVVNKVISFDYAKDTPNLNPRVSERMQVSNAGYILDEIMTKNVFAVSDRNWGDINTSYRRLLGLTASDITQSFDMMKTLMETSTDGKVTPMEIDHKVMDNFIGEAGVMNAFNKYFPNISVKDNQKRGMLKVAFESERRGLEQRLRFERSDKYRVDANKVEGIQRKLDNVNVAIRYMEELGYKNLIMEPKNYTIHKAIAGSNKLTGLRNYPERQKVFRDTYVYRFKGTSPVGKLYDSNAPKGQRQKIRWDQLDFVGSIPKRRINGKPGEYSREPGWTYIEFKDPVAPTSMDTQTLKYSYALLARTAHTEPRDFFKTRQEVDEFVTEVKALRRDIARESMEASGIFKTNRAVAPLYANISQSKLQMRITQLMNKFLYEGGTDTTPGEIRNLEKFDMALRYIIMPRSLEGFHKLSMPNGRKVDVPTYRLSDRVITEMLEWSFNSGNKGAVKVAENLLQDWERTVRNETHVNKFGYDTSKRTYSKDYYTSNLEPEFVKLSETLAMYRDPLVQQMFNDNGLLRTGKTTTMHTIDDADIYINYLFKGKQRGAWCVK